MEGLVHVSQVQELASAPEWAEPRMRGVVGEIERAVLGELSAPDFALLNALFHYASLRGPRRAHGGGARRGGGGATPGVPRAPARKESGSKRLGGEGKVASGGCTITVFPYRLACATVGWSVGP